MKSKKKTKAKKWVDKPARKPKKIKLPKFEPPTSVRAAKDMIDKLDQTLARSIHEHAYKYGIAFGVVKKEVGHGHFLAWVETNTRWSHKTVRNYMTFAEMCIRAGYLLSYRPSGDPQDKTEIISIMDSKTQQNLEDTEGVEHSETETPAMDSLLQKGNGKKEVFVWSNEWAIQRIFQSFVNVTKEYSVEVKRKVFDGAEKEIRNYVDGEEQAFDELMKSRSTNREKFKDLFKDFK